MSLKKSKQRKDDWSARGSLCPICHKEFRSEACPHNVLQAHERLHDDVLRAKIKRMMK